MSTTHLHLVPKLRISGAIPLLPLTLTKTAVYFTSTDKLEQYLKMEIIKWLGRLKEMKGGRLQNVELGVSLYGLMAVRLYSMR